MSLSNLIVHQIKKFFFGDIPHLGRLRLIFCVLFPFAMFLVDSRWTIFGNFSNLFRLMIIIYFLALISAFAPSVAYIKDIYELETDRIPLRHFIACFFGVLVPTVKVTNRIHDSDWKEMVEKIGGPAFLGIGSGYAVLTETLTAPAHIYGQGGGHYISRQERVYEVIDLHEHEGVVPEVKATTRDGIGVIVEKLRFNFRIWDHQWDMSKNNPAIIQNPFPFSKDAIHNFVYNRSVQLDEHGGYKPFTWSNVIGGRVQGIIKGYINEHRLDEVIASREHEKKNPREEIQNEAYKPGFKQGLRSMGTILRWWDPGEFRSLEDIEGQFLSNWSVDLTSNVKLNHAYGEAQKQAYEELGRAEAEAELLMSILHALDGIKFASDKTQILQNLILMRTAQVIRALNTSAPQPSVPGNHKQVTNNIDVK